MAVTVSVEQREIVKLDPIFRGNLVTGGSGKVILITKVDQESFRGIVLNGGVLVETGGWGFQYFKQFVGTVTLEASL